MKRFSGLLHRTKSHDATTTTDTHSPDANASRGVRLFCESGAPNSNGEEVLHLPVIVEAAESSPQAATAAAHQIRKYLSKDYISSPSIEFNAITVMKILADNPGPSFTRNFDTKFVDTIRDLLKRGRDPSVQQSLRETLDSWEADKANDAGLAQLLSMWHHEKGPGSRIAPTFAPQQHHRVPPTYNPNAPPIAPSQHDSNQRVFGRSQLPPPHELSSRVEEAKNTAKILLQLVQSTPQEEVMGNSLLQEFAERCQGAQRSMQDYINCDSPPADDETLQTLIEMNEQLSLALSRYQRTILSARRALGTQSTSPIPPVATTGGQYASSAFPPPPRQAPSTSAPVAMTPAVPVAIPSTTVPTITTTEFDHPAPANPPPDMLARFQVRETPSSQPPARAAPVPAAVPEAPARNSFSDQNEAEIPYAGANAYSQAPEVPPHSEPVTTASSLAPSPPRKALPVRPGAPSAYYQGPTSSYLGRQQSAVNGYTMHGVLEDDEEEEEKGLQPKDTAAARASYEEDYREGDMGHAERSSKRTSVNYRY